MTKIRKHQPLVPSILDRLLHETPEGADAARSRSQVLREMKDSVRRDLENLLNTRIWCKEIPEGLSQLATSLVNYGIPDFTGTNMSRPSERQHLRETLEEIIRRYEPRFRTVRVVLLDPLDEYDRTLRFRIDGLLHAEPAPEPVIFDSQIDSVSATIQVTSASR
jgi:type VI secretion system protein ImpF